MANSPQAKKRVKQAEKSRAHNASQRSSMRTAVKSVLKAILAGDKAAAQIAYQKASSMLDRSARKGLIHKNKAARLKSRIHNKLRALA